MNDEGVEGAAVTALASAEAADKLWPNWERQTMKSPPSMALSKSMLAPVFPLARVAAAPVNPSPRCHVRKSKPSTSRSSSKSAENAARSHAPVPLITRFSLIARPELVEYFAAHRKVLAA